MSILSLVVALGMAVTGASSISGQVLDSAGGPVAGARVFIEPGVAAPLVETAAGADGAFHFDNVPPETVGVFAIASGFGFGGVTVKVAPEAAIDGVKLQLARAATVSGKITDVKGYPVKGARITRVALLGTAKVGLPLAKLKAFGFDEPVSDDKGNFTIANLPAGASIALKADHPQYAQEAVENVPVGGTEVHVKLTEGILIEGDVVSRGTQAPVADVMVMARNAQPPNDTALTTSDSAGVFSMRLKPGIYMFQAMAAALRSAGWERMTLNKIPAPKIRLYVSGMGRIQGKVCDAVSGKPVAGAKVEIETEGNIAATARTGATGEFAAAVMAGTNVARLEPAPGYLKPEQPPLNFQVEEGKTVTLPLFWLAPIPSYSVLVVDGNDKPVPGAVLTVLRPQQFGWQMANAEGKATLTFGAWPSEGAVIGLAEHPREPLGALFALQSRSQVQLGNEKEEVALGNENGVAKVQLFPLATVKGRAVSTKGAPVEGAVAASVVGEEGAPLWWTVTGADGAFRWESVIPGARQQCVVCAAGGNASEARTFSPEVGGTTDLGDLCVPDGSTKPSLLGKPLVWNKNPLIAGTLPSEKALRESRALVIYCSAADAPMVVEGLSAAGKTDVGKGIVFAAVVDGAYNAPNVAIPVLSGKAPGAATTYVVGPEGKVLIETFGMPPVRLFQK